MNNMMFVVTANQKNPELKMDRFQYIQVNAQNNGDYGFPFKDNTGDHISEKNPHFCELTALYWIWKNTDYDHLGISHYRRFFCHNIHLLGKIKKYNIQELDHYLEKYDIIVPYPIRIKEGTVYERYCFGHNKKDLDMVISLIKEKYPSYATKMNNFLNQKNFFCYNMFYCSKKILDSYCEWLFDILFTCERTINIENYDKYQSRVFGFLSERLFNIWLLNQNYKVKYLQVIQTDLPKMKEYIRIKKNSITTRFR